MTPEEKIEALRDWAQQDFPDDWPDYWRGYFAAAKAVRDIIDPPNPKWRQMVTEEYDALLDEFKQPSLPTVLAAITSISWDEDEGPQDGLARIVAVCEREVGDGWQADPERVHPGFWGVAWLLVPLSHEPPDWAVVGDRSAAWLRSLKDEKLGTRTDAKYEHTLEPHCPVCFGVCAGSNRDGAS